MTRLDTSWGCCIGRARSRPAGWEVLSVKQGERLVDLERVVAAETLRIAQNRDVPLKSSQLNLPMDWR